MSAKTDPLEDRPAPKAPSARKFFLVAFCCVASGLLVAKLGVDMLVAERSATTLGLVEQRLAARARGKAELAVTWVDGLAAIGNRLLRSDLVRLFVTEMALGGEDPQLSGALAEQQPYMRQVMDDLARQHDLRGAYLVSTEGRTILSDSDAPRLTDDRALAASTLAAEDASLHVGAPYDSAGRFFMDVYQPVGPAQSLAGLENGVAGVLMMTFDVTAMLQKLLAVDPELHEKEVTGLLVPTGDGWQRLVVNADQVESRAIASMQSPDAAPLADPGRLALADGIYHLQAEVPVLGWQVEQRIERAVVHASLNDFALAAQGFAMAGGAIVSLLFVSFFWRLESRHHLTMAEQYRALVERIRAQNELLQTVTESTLDLVALKDQDGRYLLVSTAYAQCFARHPDQLVGLRDEDLLAADTCSQLARGEKDARALGVSLSDDITVEIAGAQRHLHVVQVPVQPEGSRGAGMLMVARDITELVEVREERERLSQQMAEAFVRAVELVDPYLEGHTQRLATLAGDLGRALDLSADEARSLELAARLSQIGKMFVPRDIVAKRERHTEEEAAIMRTHISHAGRVLDGVTFGLPVAESLAQMHERLDGSGYPHGLEAEAIGMVGRILAVADVFCARTQPRSYRDRLAEEEALGFLRQSENRYDPRVTAALADIVAARGCEASKPEPVPTG